MSPSSKIVIATIRAIMHRRDSCKMLVPSDLRVLVSEIDRLRQALEDIAKSPYGMELMNTDAENYEILSRTLASLQGKARDALK